MRLGSAASAVCPVKSGPVAQEIEENVMSCAPCQRTYSPNSGSRSRPSVISGTDIFGRLRRGALVETGEVYFEGRAHLQRQSARM